MNHDERDPILDAFLQEVFDESAPPDLTDRIVAAWAKQSSQHQENGTGQTHGGENEADAPLAPPIQLHASLAKALSNGSSPDDSDPLLDAFLQEALDESARPDLTERIVAAWASRQQSGEPMETAAPTPPPVVPPPAPPLIQSAKETRSRQSAWNSWPLVGVAAAALLVVVVTVANLGPKEVAQPDPESPAPAPSPEAPRPNPSAIVKETTPRTDKKPDGPSAFEEPLPFEQPETGSVEGVAQAPVPSRPKPAKLERDELLDSINGRLQQTWTVSKVEPSELATDAEFCRRVYIALLGRIPTVEELGGYLDRTEENKREALVQRLQNHSSYRPLYVEHWATFWTNVLVGRTERIGSRANREGLAQYLRESLTERKPYNQIVRELITAQGVNKPGEPEFNGAVNFLLDGYSKDSTLAAARTARIFHGKQIQCVQCHDHPTKETWSQQDFWQFNAFFRQMKIRRVGPKVTALVDRDFKGESGKSLDEAEIFFERPDGRKGVAYPVFWDGREISKRGDVASVNRREKLADFMTDSRDLSRAAVNRLWAHFFRYGLVNPIEDLDEQQATGQAAVLETLAEQFEANDYDLDQLIGWLATSEAFQLSSQASEAAIAADDPEAGRQPLFARYYTRQMSPESAFNSLLLAAQGRLQRGAAGDAEQISAQKEWFSQITRNMNTDEGQETNAFTGDIRQSVAVMTSKVMRDAVTGKRGLLHKVTTDPNKSVREKIEYLFLAAFSRKPTPKEYKWVSGIVERRGGDIASSLQDVWWALLNSNEFILNH